MDTVQIIYLVVFSTLIVLMLVTSFFFMVYVIFFRDSLLSPYEDESNCIPESMQYKEIDQPELWDQLPAVEKVRFKLARQFFRRNRPELVYVSFLNYDEIDATYLLIRDRGIRSFYFQAYQDQLSDLIQDVEDDEADVLEDRESVNEESPLLERSTTVKSTYSATDEDGSSDYRRLGFGKVPYLVEDLTEIAFQSAEMSSCILNMPLPYKNRKNDTIYFETKFYEFNPTTTTIAVGLVTTPYPNFQLPGMSPYSVAIQSNGTVRMNNMPYLNDDLPVVLPQLLEGDVVGVGFRSITGTVFITHNGKLILELVKHLKVELYPCIGSYGGSCKVSVNLGQLGFVYIEANVKKLGFCEGQNEGAIGAPPGYNSFFDDPVLDQGEVLPPEYPDEEVSFFGGRFGSYPPSYKSEKDIDVESPQSRQSRKRERKKEKRKKHNDKKKGKGKGKGKDS